MSNDKRDSVQISRFALINKSLLTWFNANIINSFFDKLTGVTSPFKFRAELLATFQEIKFRRANSPESKKLAERNRSSTVSWMGRVEREKHARVCLFDM